MTDTAPSREIPHLREAAEIYLDRYGRTREAAEDVGSRADLYLIDTVGPTRMRNVCSLPYDDDSDDELLVDALDWLLHRRDPKLPTADNVVDMLVMATMTSAVRYGQRTRGIEVLVVDGDAQVLQATWGGTSKPPEFIFDPHRHSPQVDTAVLARLLALRLMLAGYYSQPANTTGPGTAAAPPPAPAPSRRSTELLGELIAAASGEVYVPEEACVRAVSDPDTMQAFLLAAGELAAVNALGDLYLDAFAVLADNFPDHADDIHTAVTRWRELDDRRDTLIATVNDLGTRLEILEPPPAPGPLG